jgi:hypothetical protein
MKTKTFLFLVILLGLSMTQLTAQNGKNGTGSVTYPDKHTDFYVPAYCYDETLGDYVIVDELIGTFTYHIIDHYKNGVLVWEMGPGKGEATSLTTGEVFKWEEKDKVKPISDGLDYYHYNLIGNRGTRYMGYVVYDFSDGSFTCLKAVCPGNDE